MDYGTGFDNHLAQPDLQIDTASSSPLRIAICPPEFQPLLQAMNGESTDATYLIQSYIAQGLLAHGHSLTFIAPRSLTEVVSTQVVSQPALAPRTWSGSAWFEFSSRAAWWLQRRLRVPYLNMFSNYRLLDACLQCLPGHDVVYERNSMYRFGVAMACKRLRLPYVLYFEADDILEHDVMGRPVTGLLRWRLSKALRFNLSVANCVICVSEPARQHLIAAWDASPQKIVVLPNAADVRRFQPASEIGQQIRAALGMDNNPIVMFVGSFYKWHDVATLITSFAQIVRVYPETRLVLIGDGEQRQDMMQLSASLDIGRAVRFTGSVPHAEIPRWLAAADIAVAPYPQMQHEMWLSPIKVFEYMASGKAVVASAVGQLNKVISDGQSGLLVPPGDATAMTAALRRLIENEGLRSQLGRYARDEAVRKYSWEHYLSRLERVCAAVVAHKLAPCDRSSAV
ncbi:MAG TPA: glycosyltransferase family 4 protein [Aggregatilineales bacterium]|nr:glycosyltransferase family 4 protein [Aggregatilineales bacterium]